MPGRRAKKKQCTACTLNDSSSPFEVEVYAADSNPRDSVNWLKVKYLGKFGDLSLLARVTIILPGNYLVALYGFHLIRLSVARNHPQNIVLRLNG